MKKFLIFLGFLAAASTAAVAQATTIPGASQTSVALSWSLPTIPTGSTWTGCTAAQPCTFRPFRITGSCPASLVGANATQLADTGNNATSATDSAATGQVSYVVETVQNGLLSGPSNCVTVTVPNVPSPAVITAH